MFIVIQTLHCNHTTCFLVNFLSKIIMTALFASGIVHFVKDYDPDVTI